MLQRFEHDICELFESVEQRSLQWRKKSRKFTSQESEAIVAAYVHFNGNWEKIMKADTLRATVVDKSEKQIKDHYPYITNQKNQKKEGTSAKRTRENIIDALQDSATASQSQKAYEIVFDDEPAVLDAKEQLLDDAEKKNTSSAISSASMSSVDNVMQVAEEEHVAKKIRLQKILEKKEEKDQILTNIRNQEANRATNEDMKTMLLATIMQTMQATQMQMQQSISPSKGKKSADFDYVIWLRTTLGDIDDLGAIVTAFRKAEYTSRHTLRYLTDADLDAIELHMTMPLSAVRRKKLIEAAKDL